MELGLHGKYSSSSTDEDTEDASEPEQFTMEEDTRRSYESKIAALKKQLIQIQEGKDPEYCCRIQELKELKDKQILMAETFRDYELQMAREERDREREQATLEYESKKAELKDSLLLDLQEKKKAFENLRSTMEITTGAYLFEPKMMVTRKLRRRHYDVPVPEKRRRASPFFSTLIYELDEATIEEDLKYICKGKALPGSGSGSSSKFSIAPALSVTTTPPEMTYDVRVEEGKLHYEGKSYGKNQHIIVESKDRGIETAIITSISNTEIIVKLLPDNAKLRIYLSHLSRGKYVIRKKSSSS